MKQSSSARMRAVAASDVHVLQIRPESCTVRFSVRFLGLLHIRGELSQGTGTVLLSENGESCAIDVVLPLATLHTGIAMRDRHLRSRHYFDGARHPAITFNGTGRRCSAETWEVSGVAHVGNTELPITLALRGLEGSSAAAVSGKSPAVPAEYLGRAVIDRRDLRLGGTPILGRHLSLDDVVLGRDVRLELRCVIGSDQRGT